ncbi:aconitate hydratase 1 [Escherichia coli]|uniref:Aconitate hydratase 1 n=1 Tax=Escherichia coli TaxID=562 RepID=A0A377D1D5_ECOLX|nr:aconitate hydratase 1 [Escherichia coli]
MSSTLREASKDTLQAKDKTYHYYSLPLAAKSLGDITRLPKSLKVLLENLLRWQDGNSVTEEDIPRAGRMAEKCPMLTVKLPTARQGC